MVTIEPIKFASLPLSQIIREQYRLDASAYSSEAMMARNALAHLANGYVPMMGENGLVADAFVCGRFKRIYTDNKNDIPFFLPSNIEEAYPKPSKFISPLTKVDIDSLRVHKGMLLMSCSGTIGKTALVGDTLDNQVFSHDLLRITFKEDYDLGYVYTYLNTELGLTILRSNNYGAVVDHIEPEHLTRVPVPNAPIDLRKRINALVQRALELQNESNKLMAEAQFLLASELNLPDLDKLKEGFNVPKNGD